MDSPGFMTEAIMPDLLPIVLERSAEGAGEYKFSTKQLRPEARFDAPKFMRAETVDLRPAPQSSEMFEADFDCWTFGDLVLTKTVYANAPERLRRHRQRSFIDHRWVVLAFSGAWDQEARSSSDARHQNLSFRSLALPFEGAANGTEVLTLFLPRDFCRDELEHFERAHGLDVYPHLGAVLASYMEGLAQQLPYLSREHTDALAAPTRALVAACIAPRAERFEAAEVHMASRLIDRARHVVRQNMASPDFGPEQLARLMAMSRSKLYRLFEGTDGVARFINRERLREAYRRLGSSCGSRSIHVVGNEVGFTDHSTFSRAFRREFGCSPTEARERGLAELSAEPPGFMVNEACRRARPER
jgi:AraC-like DNA-binding protein